MSNNTFWVIALEGKWAHTEKEKKSLTPVEFEPTTSGTDPPLLYRLNYKAR